MRTQSEDKVVNRIILIRHFSFCALGGVRSNR